MSGHTCHGVHVEIRGQQCGVTSLLLPLRGLCEDQSQPTGIPCKRFTPKASCRPLPLHILNALRFSKQCCVLQFIFDPLQCDTVVANGSGLGVTFASLAMDRWRQCSALSLSRCARPSVCCSQPWEVCAPGLPLLVLWEFPFHHWLPIKDIKTEP